nr:hypothetical protein [Candidatus Njordarchaeota archaeon]
MFDKHKSKYVKEDEMKQRLIEENLTQEEAEQAISLAEANEVIRWCLPYVGEIRGEPSYELLTEEEIKWQEEEELQDLEEDTQIRMKKRRIPKKTKKGEKEAR